MIHLVPGLYAEGPTDYRFLLPLIPQVLHEVAVRTVPEEVNVAEAVPIDAPAEERSKARTRRLPAAIDAYRDQCTLFVVHTDGAGDPMGARRNNVVRPLAGLAAPPVIACVPVREIEAWLLCDPVAFTRWLGNGVEPKLPRDPERVGDPKQVLFETVRALRASPAEAYSFFGANVALTALRRLAAFRAFETEIEHALKALARPVRAQRS